MNTLAEILPHQFADENASIESALVQAGWQAQGLAAWKLDTKRGAAMLTETAHRDHWRQFQLTGGATPVARNSRLLQANHRLRGPAKFVARAGDIPVCRLDVPDDLADPASGSFALGAEHGQDVCGSWVQAVTELAAGESGAENLFGSLEAASVERSSFSSDGEAVADDTIAAEAKEAGWSIANDNGQTVIHLQLPGVYRQLSLQRNKSGGARLGVHLIDLAGLDDTCLRAIFLLAVEANGRLPLVRMAVSRPSKHKSAALHAEASFGAALVSGSLLLHALQVFETTVRLTAREFDSLRDSELARRVVEAAAVRNPQGQF